MQVFHEQSKYPIFSSRFINIILLPSTLCIFYLLFSMVVFPSSTFLHNSEEKSSPPSPNLSLPHLVFGLASNLYSWPKRKEFLSLWWKPHLMRGCVFLDSPLPSSSPSSSDPALPPLCVSGNTSGFRYTNRGGLRSAIRVARVVSEMVSLNHSDVRWFVFGDDDTVFFPDNLVKTLSKYDHNLWYYIGTNSEIYEQNRFFSFDMAFGGAGFALSYPLAVVLAELFDSCIQRYPHLYGSDGRIYHCISELGVPLTHERGFHQMDFHGDVFGLLAAHPQTPLLSLHHLDYLDPIFPNVTETEALARLMNASRLDEERLLQQTVCYRRTPQWTVSVSWGYAVQIFPTHMHLKDVLSVQKTFRQWRTGTPMAAAYTFNSRQLHPDPCKRAAVFFFHSSASASASAALSPQLSSITTTVYRKHNASTKCSRPSPSLRSMKEVIVVSSKMDSDSKQLQARRRQCCDVLEEGGSGGGKVKVVIRECGQKEMVYAKA